MAKKNIYLEKRIFLLFFLLSFIMVLILILIEWQLARYWIIQAENKEIMEINSTFRSNLHELYLERSSILDSFVSDPAFQTAIQSEDNYLTRVLLQEASVPDGIHIIYYNQNEQRIFGEEWEFLEEQIKQIFSIPASNYAISSYSNKFYLVSFKEIFYDENFSGVLVSLEEFKLSMLPQMKPGIKYLLKSYPLVDSSLSSELLQNKITQFNQLIEDNLNNDQLNTVFRTSNSQAVSLLICPYFQFPSTVFLIDHPRDIYNFGQQSVLLFVLILLAVTIILIIVFGNWFSRSILYPIRTINQRMNEISLNPSRIEPLEKNYKGVLGEMLHTFNLMNRSLSKYSENLREYKLISDNLDSGFFWLDDKLKITLCNNSLFMILDIYSSEKLIGKSLNDFLNLNDNHLEILYEEGITLHEWQINTGKNRKFLLIKIMPVRKEASLKFVGNITDITSKIEERTARQALELELIKSNKLAEIGRRIEGIVHNINSPLNTVLGYAQLLKKNQSENQDITKIMEAGKSISHIVKGVLNKSKLDSSSMVRSINITHLIKQELELCNHNLFFKHYVDLQTELQEDLPEINAVYGDISLCLANILNNAIEALENRTEKKIWVKTYPKNNTLIIEIKDSGEGIKKKNLDIIFEPYFTTKTKPDDKGSGFGLGLAISKNIVNRYGGRIEVESVIDHGSIFTIIIPLEKPLEKKKNG